MRGVPAEGRTIKRANPSTIQDKFLVGYQGWYTCGGDGEAIVRGHPGWMHWFNRPIPIGGKPNFDLWPDVSEYSPSELFPVPGLKTTDGELVNLFSSRNAQTVQRHFNWMAQNGVDGAFLQRHADQCDVEAGAEAFLRLRDEVGDRVKEAAEKEGRVFAIMYNVSQVPADRIQRVLERDWVHLLQDKGILNSPNYLREKGKPVVGLHGFGFAESGHTPQLVSAIAAFFRSATPGGAYLMAGVPAHWRTSSNDADSNPGFVDVWLNDFDAISPWTVGRYKNDQEADNFAEVVLDPDAELLKSHHARGGKKVDYVPVVHPGYSAFNMSEGRFGYNEAKRGGGKFLWKQIFNARRTGSRIMFGAMWDEYDDGTVLMPVVEKSRRVPHSDKFHFMALDADGVDLPSDWYMRICGFAAEGLRSERRIYESFPSKELQDYWANRPKYEERGQTGQASGSGSSANADDEQAKNAYTEWLATQKDDKERPPPPPYSLEAEELEASSSVVPGGSSSSAGVSSPQPAVTAPTATASQNNPSVDTLANSLASQRISPETRPGNIVASPYPPSNEPHHVSLSTSPQQTSFPSQLTSQEAISPLSNPYDQRPNAAQGAFPPASRPSLDQYGQPASPAHSTLSHSSSGSYGQPSVPQQGAYPHHNAGHPVSRPHTAASHQHAQQASYQPPTGTPRPGSRPGSRPPTSSGHHRTSSNPPLSVPGRAGSQPGTPNWPPAEWGAVHPGHGTEQQPYRPYSAQSQSTPPTEPQGPPATQSSWTPAAGGANLSRPHTFAASRPSGAQAPSMHSVNPGYRPGTSQAVSSPHNLAGVGVGYRPPSAGGVSLPHATGHGVDSGYRPPPASNMAPPQQPPPGASSYFPGRVEPVGGGYRPPTNMSQSSPAPVPGAFPSSNIVTPPTQHSYRPPGVIPNNPPPQASSHYTEPSAPAHHVQMGPGTSYPQQFSGSGGQHPYANPNVQQDLGPQFPSGPDIAGQPQQSYRPPPLKGNGMSPPSQGQQQMSSYPAQQHGQHANANVNPTYNVAPPSSYDMGNTYVNAPSGPSFPQGPGQAQQLQQGPTLPPRPPPRPQTSSSWSSGQSQNVSFPNPSPGPSSSLGNGYDYAMNAFDKLTNEKYARQRKALEDSVGSLAQTGTKLFGKKFSK